MREAMGDMCEGCPRETIFDEVDPRYTWQVLQHAARPPLAAAEFDVFEADRRRDTLYLWDGE